MVFNWADQDMLRASIASGSKRHAAQGQVVTLRTARGEYDLARPAIKQLRHVLAGCLEGVLGALTERVHRGWVAKDLPEVGQHCIKHPLVDGRGRCVIQVYLLSVVQVFWIIARLQAVDS